jgi:nucleoside-diphosphate-sugar epimerase
VRAVTAPGLALGPEPHRVLVTGSAGYFGGLLAGWLADRGIKVVGLDRLAPPETDPRIVSVRADLRDAEAVLDAFAKEGPFDAVFHCAALMGHEKPDPQDLWDSNVEGTRNVALAAIAHGVRKLVYTSTICVFGREYPHLVGEDEEVCPIEPYGRSKLEGERVLQSLADRLDSDAIRCPTIVSAGRLGLLSILFEFVEEGRRVYLVGDGSNRYGFVYAPDLCEACLLASRAPGSHVYHVGSDRVKTLREVYQGVIDEAGSRSRLASLPEAPAIGTLKLLFKLGLSPLGPYHARLINGTFVFDTTRIKTDLGWKPTRSNDEMLREAYRHYADHKPGRAEGLAAHRQTAKMGVLRLVKWLS